MGFFRDLFSGNLFKKSRIKKLPEGSSNSTDDNATIMDADEYRKRERESAKQEQVRNLEAQQNGEGIQIPEGTIEQVNLNEVIGQQSQVVDNSNNSERQQSQNTSTQKEWPTIRDYVDANGLKDTQIDSRAVSQYVTSNQTESAKRKEMLEQQKAENAQRKKDGIFSRFKRKIKNNSNKQEEQSKQSEEQENEQDGAEQTTQANTEQQNNKKRDRGIPVHELSKEEKRKQLINTIPTIALVGTLVLARRRNCCRISCRS